MKATDGTGRCGLWAKPGDVYLATERLRKLFEGVARVLLVDNDVACLRGEDVRGLLERAGASRHLKPVAVDCDLSGDELTEIRRNNGLESSTWSRIEDKTICGLDLLLDKLATLDRAERRERARDLWDDLTDLNRRRGSGPFNAVYSWGWHSEMKRASFAPAFVRTLNRSRWVPDSSGELRLPRSVTFEAAGWTPNSVLQSRIDFKPPALSHLAREAGIELGVLDLLREMGVTSEADLRTRLGANQDGEEGRRIQDDSGVQFPPAEPRPTPSDDDESNCDGSDANNVRAERPPTASVGPRQFFTYVSVVPEDEAEADPDRLEHSIRMDLERSAIKFILDLEPGWQRTAVNNPGFDLYRGSTIETATQWCEVKAMTGTLDDRPVGMSRAQFECAQDHGDSYWLYVVERAGTNAPHLVPIRDPAGKAKTFTFDRGWRSAADDGSGRSLI